MLSSTPTSQGGMGRKAGMETARLFLADADDGDRVGAGGLLDGADLHHGEEQPEQREVNGQPCELVAGARAERAGATRAAQGADQAAALAALDQNQQDQERAQQEQNQVQRTRKPSPHECVSPARPQYRQNVI